MSRPLADVRKRRAVLAAAAAAVAAVVGLSAKRLQPAGSAGPAPVLFGVDTCDQCGMVIRERRWAAQMITGGGRVRKFDDVGCLVAYQLRHHPGWKGVVAAFVADWSTEQWIEARQAWWVRTRHKSPMLYGLVTLGERGRAERMAAEHGSRVLTYEEVARLDLFSKQPGPSHHSPGAGENGL